jgi:elongation factor Ts
MHVAAMNPMAVSEDSISQEVKDRELAVAIDKTKDELIGKEVEKALRKAGINPNHVDSDDHIDSNITKGYITAEQGAQAREIKATVPGTVNLNEGMVQNIAKGRLGKFFKENCLLNQVSLVADPKTVAQYIQDADKEATVKAFYRVKLGE